MKKSPYDPREYKSMIMPNKMRVIMVSDKDTTISAATMMVGVGSFDDTIDGQAHFLEHLLFMGSKKYPDENCYGDFVSTHGGSTNAYTDVINTCYYFSVNSDSFCEALDIYSRFFIDPLLTDSAVEREMNAVDAEFKGNLTHESWRNHMVTKLMVNPDHPYRRFTIGNKETLNVDGIFEHVKKLHADYYSADIMNLCIVDNKPINEIESYVVEMFSQVENKNVSAKINRNYPRLLTHTKKCVKIVPIKRNHKLTIMWEFPGYSKYWLVSPLNFLGHLMGHECDGSILQTLKNLDWATSLRAGVCDEWGDQSTSTVTISMTEEGVKHISEIIAIVYEYITLISKCTMAEIEELYNDYHEVSKITWLFAPKNDALSYSNDIAYSMFKNHFIPLDDVIVSNSMFKPFDTKTYDMIRAFLHLFNHDNSIVILVSPENANVADQTELIFGAKYCVNDIAYLDKTDKFRDLLSLPKRNMFVPSNFDMVMEPNDELPRKINADKYPFFNNLWIKVNTKFNLPHAKIYINLKPKNWYGNVRMTLITTFLAEMFSEYVNPTLYYANQLDYNAFVYQTDGSLGLCVGGYAEKIYDLTQFLFTTLKCAPYTQKMLDRARERLVKSWENEKLSAPYDTIKYMLQEWIDPKYVSAEKLLSEHMSVTLEDIKNYFNDNSFFVSGLIEGNITQYNAEKIFGIPACIIQNTHDAEQEPHIKYIDDSKSIESCKYYHPNAAETNSCVAIFCKYKYLAFSDEYYENMSMYRIMSAINCDKFFNQLRTLEQLGYAVSSYQKYFGESSYRLCGQIYIIQTATYTTTHLCERINDFIVKFLDVLETMSDEKFEEYKMNTILSINEAHESLDTEFGDDVNSLITNDGFDRVKQLTKYTKAMTKNDLVKFYREYFIDSMSGWTLEVLGNVDDLTESSPKRRRVDV